MLGAMSVMSVIKDAFSQAADITLWPIPSIRLYAVTGCKLQVSA